MAKRRVELKFQDHICDSYAACHGYARKWATEWQVGMPDLVASLPHYGCHLAEVKHRPEFVMGGDYKNPLDPKQRQVARKYTEGGGLVFGLVVIESIKALESSLTIFDPSVETVCIRPHNTVPYEATKKYDMALLVEAINRKE